MSALHCSEFLGGQLLSRGSAIEEVRPADFGCHLTFAPGSEDIRLALARILGSSAFSGGARLKAFLAFIVESALAGNVRSLKAYTIGVDALERNASFDPSTDAIVRVEATRLRAALARYYKSEGSTNPVLISMPAGSYVPRFTWNDSILDAHARARAFSEDFLRESRRLRLLREEAAMRRTAIKEMVADLMREFAACRTGLREVRATLAAAHDMAVMRIELPSEPRENAAGPKASRVPLRDADDI